MFGYGWKSDVNKYLKGTKGISRAAALSTNKGIRTAGKIAGKLGPSQIEGEVVLGLMHVQRWSCIAYLILSGCRVEAISLMGRGKSVGPRRLQRYDFVVLTDLVH